MRVAKRTVGVWLAAAVLAVACGDNVEDEMTETAVQESMTPQPVTEAQAAAATGELVTATLSEWRIVVVPDTIGAGTLTFRVRNAGEVEHAFEIESADGEEWEIEDIAPRAEEQTLTVELTPGTYQIYCPLEGERGRHADLGMRTTLVVR